MTDPARTFAVASDDALVALVTAARQRLVVIAPALTVAVADALAQRLGDLDQLAVTVILDSDPEVYRLGFGDQEALAIVRTASANNMFDLREQLGVRIGVVIADDTTMIFSPAPRAIEAGSTSTEKPNAIVLTGAASERIAVAAGAAEGDFGQETELGREALEPAHVEAMQADLEANPPKPFDIARKLNVFSSKVQYVEFSATNYRLTTRRIPLPQDLVDVADQDLRNRISSRIQAPFEGVGKIRIEICQGDEVEVLDVDDDSLKHERKAIEDGLTFQVNNFGRVILSADRREFDRATKRFELIVLAYQAALAERLETSRTDFEDRIVREFGPRWAAKPPERFVRWKTELTATNIEAELRRLAAAMFSEAVNFDPPTVRTLYKNVALETFETPQFIDALMATMKKRGAPNALIDSLFETGHAAPEKGSFLR